MRLRSPVGVLPKPVRHGRRVSQHSQQRWVFWPPDVLPKNTNGGTVFVQAPVVRFRKCPSRQRVPLEREARCSHMNMSVFSPLKGTLQGTNISPKNCILKMIFLFPRWDMLIPWRVLYNHWNWNSYHCETETHTEKTKLVFQALFFALERIPHGQIIRNLDFPEKNRNFPYSLLPFEGKKTHSLKNLCTSCCDETFTKKNDKFPVNRLSKQNTLKNEQKMMCLRKEFSFQLEGFLVSSC